MKIYLTAELQHMAAEEMRDVLDPSAMAYIKTQDPNPHIEVYKIAHEGAAVGNVVGLGQKTIQYFRAAIKAISDKLQIGALVFDDHGATNDHAGRVAIGQVVGKALREIGGKLHAVAATYILPAHRDTRRNIASIEADIVLETNGEDVRLADIPKVTGIALGSSKDQPPGFTGATLLGEFQAFREAHITHTGGKTMTREEMQAAIREGKFKPSDLFDTDQLEADTAVLKMRQTDYEHIRRVEKQLGAARDGATETEATKDAAISRLKAEVLRSEHKPLFAELAGDNGRNLDTRQRTFMEQKFDSFQTDADTPEAVKAAMGVWIDEQLVQFDKTAKIFAEGGGNGDGQDGGGGKGAPAGDDTPLDGGNYADPKTNPLIPGGEAAARAAAAARA